MNYRQFAHIIVIKLYAWWAHKSLIMMCKAWCLQIKGCCCMTDFVLDILLLFADLAILFGQQALSRKKKTLNITCKYDPTDRNQCMLIESMTSKSKYCNKRTPYVNLLGVLSTYSSYILPFWSGFFNLLLIWQKIFIWQLPCAYSSSYKVSWHFHP